MIDACQTLCLQAIMCRAPVTHAGEMLGINSERECFLVRFRQRRRADRVYVRVALGELTLQPNETNQTDQINKITIFGCRLASFYREVFHEFFGKERGLEHPPYAGQHLPVYPEGRLLPRHSRAGPDKHVPMVIKPVTDLG